MPATIVQRTHDVPQDGQAVLHRLATLGGLSILALSGSVVVLPGGFVSGSGTNDQSTETNGLRVLIEFFDT